jgi:uncharacterized protein with GYD domain
MAKYLWEGSYTVEGVKGLVKEGGTSRRQAMTELVQKMGGKVEAFYFAFGQADFFVIVDLPDASSAAAVSLAVAQAGSVEMKTHVLLTPEEMDQACKKPVGYHAPGR